MTSAESGVVRDWQVGMMNDVRSQRKKGGMSRLAYVVHGKSAFFLNLPIGASGRR